MPCTPTSLQRDPPDLFFGRSRDTLLTDGFMLVKSLQRSRCLAGRAAASTGLLPLKLHHPAGAGMGEGGSTQSSAGHATSRHGQEGTAQPCARRSQAGEVKSGPSRLISSCEPSCLPPSPAQPRCKRSTARQTSITAEAANERSPGAALGAGVHGCSLGARAQSRSSGINLFRGLWPRQALPDRGGFCPSLHRAGKKNTTTHKRSTKRFILPTLPSQQLGFI